jgi:tetratricopeptide (TPR) repeat protein
VGKCFAVAAALALLAELPSASATEADSPTVEASAARARATAVSKSASAAHAAGNYAEAADLYHSAFSLDPNEPLYLYSAARAEQAGKLFDKAIRDFKAFLGLVADNHPKVNDAARYLQRTREAAGSESSGEAQFAFSAGRYVEASQLFHRAFAYDSSEPLYLYSAARAEQDGKLFDDAIRDFKAFLGLVPDNHPKVNDAARYLRRTREAAGYESSREGQLAFSAGRYVEAALKFHRAFAYDYSSPKHLYDAARAEQAAGNFKESLRDFEEFLRIASVTSSGYHEAQQQVQEVRRAIKRRDSGAGLGKASEPAREERVGATKNSRRDESRQGDIGGTSRTRRNFAADPGSAKPSKPAEWRQPVGQALVVTGGLGLLVGLRTWSGARDDETKLLTAVAPGVNPTITYVDALAQARRIEGNYRLAGTVTLVSAGVAILGILIWPKSSGVVSVAPAPDGIVVGAVW